MPETTAQVTEAFRSLLGLRSFTQELDRLPADTTRLDDESFLGFCYKNCHRSHAQLFQDLFVAYQLREKQGGYFVEFGAADGIDLSNTCLLEKDYRWRGILAEPARIWHERLGRNRACIVDHRCVWSKSGETLGFNETAQPELSTLDAYTASDGHAPAREGGKRYQVATVTLNDLLAGHGAPRQIDYLSVDTEGSELEILRGFDFERYRVEIITVEHNHAPAREQIHALLESKGFRRKFEPLSQWDGWYVAA
jgi:FkbM family methyltransferase